MAANPQSFSQTPAVPSQIPSKQEKKGWDKWAPTTKVSVGVAAGALATLIVPFLAPHWKSWTGSDWAPANVVAPPHGHPYVRDPVHSAREEVGANGKSLGSDAVAGIRRLDHSRVCRWTAYHLRLGY